MQIVVLGAGRIGVQVAQTLSQENNRVVFIERVRKRAMRAQTLIDCKVIIDEGMSREVFEKADIATADYFIATTDSDEVNIVACKIAKKFSETIKCIARIRNKEYSDNYDEMKELFCVDHIVTPEREAAYAIIRSIEYGGGVSDVYTFQDFGRIIMRNIVVSSTSVVKDVAIKDIISITKVPHILEGKFLLALIDRKGQNIIPSGDTKLKEGDELFFIGEHDVLDVLFTHLGKRSKEAKAIKKMMIIGGGEVGTQLVDCYLNTHSNNLSHIIRKKRFATRDITIVESDLTRCRELAEIFHDVTILHADVSEENVLEEIEINSFDMVIASTNSQERNIVIGAHSHKLGVKYTIALVESQVYLKIAADLGIGYSLSIKNEVTESIRSYLSGKMSLYSIIREKSYEIFRCTVQKDSKIDHTNIADIVLPKQSIILCVNNRETGSVIASGNTIIEVDDTVLCLAPSSECEKVQALFGQSISDITEA